MWLTHIQILSLSLTHTCESHEWQQQQNDELYDVVVSAFVALRKLRRIRDLEAMVAKLGA